MGHQPRVEQRDARRSLRSGHSRLTRYGLRALLVAGAAGAAWLLGSHAANAADHHSAAAQCGTGGAAGSLVSGTSQLVGGLAAPLADPATPGTRTPPGVANNAAAGAQACDGRHAPSQDETAAPHQAAPPAAAPVATSGAAPSIGRPRTAVPSTGATLAGVVSSSLGTPATPVSANLRSPATPAGAGSRDRSPTVPANTQGRPTGPGSPLGPVGSVLAPVVHTAGTVTAPLTAPLVDATRPVAGVLGVAARPLPGVCGSALAPVTAVLTNGLDHLSGPLGAVPPSGTPHQASGRHGAIATPALPAFRQTVAMQGTGHPSATWTGHGMGSGHHAGTDAVPANPGPNAPPAYPGSGLPSGGTLGSTVAHAASGVTAPAQSPAVTADDAASRVRPVTATAGMPREREADPAVSPD